MKKTKFKEVVIEIIQSLGMFISNIQKQVCLGFYRVYLLLKCHSIYLIKQYYQ